MITNFNTYQLYEKAQAIDIGILYEKAKTKKAYQRKNVIYKVLKDYKINIYFASTFGTALAYLIPLIENFISNSTISLKLGTYEITLLSVFAIAEILNIKKEGIKEIGKTLKEKGLSGLIEKVKNNFKSIYKITVEVAKVFGKTIEKFIEMFGYTMVGIPIWQTLTEITQDGFNLETLPQKIIGIVTGGGAFYIKQLVAKVVDLLSKKSNINENTKI